MRVRAIQTGHYGILRVPGGKHEEFDLKDPSHFSDVWMERVEAQEPEEERPLSKRPIAELRDMAEAKGIDHDGVSKADLVELLEADA